MSGVGDWSDASKLPLGLEELEDRAKTSADSAELSADLLEVIVIPALASKYFRTFSAPALRNPVAECGVSDASCVSDGFIE